MGRKLLPWSRAPTRPIPAFTVVQTLTDRPSQ